MKRTDQQRKAIQKYCSQVADTLNDAGLDMRVVLKPEVEIPWTMDSVKDHMWKGIQEAMFDKASTTQLETGEVTKVYEVMNRHLAKHGVSVPFPSIEPPMLGQERDKNQSNEEWVADYDSVSDNKGESNV